MSPAEILKLKTGRRVRVVFSKSMPCAEAVFIRTLPGGQHILCRPVGENRERRAHHSQVRNGAL